MLRKYVLDSDYVVEFGPLLRREDLTYEEQPIKIVDKIKDQILRWRTTPYVKIQWRPKSKILACAYMGKETLYLCACVLGGGPRCGYI